MTNLLSKLIGEKKEYQEYQNEINQLPKDYSTMMKALESYMWNYAKGDGFMKVLRAVLEMFQESASENVPINLVIGKDPVAFADKIMAEYPDDLWISKQRQKLTDQYKKILKS